MAKAIVGQMIGLYLSYSAFYEEERQKSSERHQEKHWHVLEY